MKPNAVLFKLDDGKVCCFKRTNDEWDFDNLIHLKNVENLFPDISAKDPFEWVFGFYDENKFTTTNIKTTFLKGSFLLFNDMKILNNTIILDYISLFEKEAFTRSENSQPL